MAKEIAINGGTEMTSAIGCSVSSEWSAEFKVPSQDEWASQKRTVELPNGITMAYTDVGDRAGKPLLMIHGYTDTNRAWSEVSCYLEGRRLIAIDLRGHGNSSAPESGYSVDDLAHDVSLFLALKQLGKVDVIGHSLGSMTAQMLAAFYPAQVGKVILVSSALKVRAGAGSWIWESVMTLEFPLDPNSKFLLDWYWSPNPVNPSLEKLSRQESANIAPHVWRAVVRALSITDLSLVQPFIKSQLLFIWGDRDRLFGRADRDDLRETHPGAQFVTIEGAGHNPIWEFPQKSAEIIEDFLTD